MKVFKYIFKQKLLIFFTILLLIIESMCTFVTPYASSLVIDYGIQQNGMVFGVPVDLDATSYQLITRLVDGADKKLVEQSYMEHKSWENYGSDLNSNVYYELNPYGVLNATKLEKIFMPIYGLAAEQSVGPNSYNDLRASDVSSIPDDVFDQLKSYILAYSETHDYTQMYKSTIEEKKVENEYLGLSNYWTQVNFVTGITIFMIVIVVIYLFVTILGTYLASKISFRISRDLRKQQFEKVMSFSNHDMDKFSRASLITRATNDLQVVQNTSVFILRSMLIAPLMLVVGFSMALITAPSLVWLVGAAIVFMIIIAVILLSSVVPKYKMVQKLIDKINSIARESISGVPIIRALNNEEFQEGRFSEVNKKLYKTMLFAVSVLIIAMPIIMLTVNILSVSILWVGSFQLQAGNVNIGQLIAFISYSTETIFAFLSIAAGFVMLPRADVSMGRIEELLNHKLKIQNFDIKTKKADKKVKDEEYIRFDNVTFKYEGNKKNLFNNLNVKIKKGSLNAIVGPTGSGKTTFLKLLLRYYDVNKGSVCIEGVNVKDFNEKDLRDTISYVPQKVFLFEGSLKENVSLNPKVKDKDLIEKSLRFANLGSFVDSNKEGINYKVSQGAINLSGGQKQRLTIARAISEQLPIILFDDPFSALDANTEKKINKGLQEKFGDSTILLVTQRLSSVVNYDNIIFMDEGKVVAAGTHKQLLKNKKYMQAFNKAKSPTIKEVK